MQTGIKNKKTGRRRRNPSSQELVRAFSFAMIAMGAGGVGGLTYATQVEPAWVETTDIRLALPRLPEVFAGYRIVQISDLHIEWMGRNAWQA